MIEKITKVKKVLDWARDKNDFFCLHDIATFYDMEDQTQLAATIGKLVQTGKLTKTDIKSNCKYSSNKHSFYIFNKEKPIAKTEEPSTVKPRKQKANVKKMILASIEKQKEPFCVHMIAKDTGFDMKTMLDYLFLLRKHGLIKKEGRNHCPERKNHQFYTAKNARQEGTNEKTKTEKIIEAIKNQRGEFCSHDIARETGVDLMYVQAKLHSLTKRRKLRFVGKKPCQTFASIHRFYERIGKRMWAGRKKYTRRHAERPIAKIEQTRKLSEYIKAAKEARTAKEQAQIPTYIPQGKIPPENIKQRVETCSCGCGKRKIIIEIYLD